MIVLFYISYESSAAEKAKSWVAQWTTHDWSLGGPSQFWVVRQWYTETIKSINSLRPSDAYMRQ